MPRFARVVIPECPHHVTQRGNERRDIFFTPTDRQTYLSLLQHFARIYCVDVLGYCLMTNHVHLVLLPRGAESMAKLLREVHMRYSQYRHALELGSGHLWQGRYYSCVLEPARLSSVMRYVELNPVRAGLASDAGHYTWSSAAVHLGGRDPARLIAMADWNQCWTPPEWQAVLTQGAEESAAIRDATYSGRPLGSHEFVATLEQSTGRRLRRGRAGRPTTTERQLCSSGKI